MGVSTGVYSQNLLYGGAIQRIKGPDILEAIRLAHLHLQKFPLDLNIFSDENETYLRKLNILRRRINVDPAIRRQMIQILIRAGFSHNMYVDLVRFRCIPARFHEHPAARALLCWHRDTFYANANCQMNLWIPLSDCDASNGMGFFRDYLDKPVENDSHLFDLDRWQSSGGFQAFRKKAGAIHASTGLNYPSALHPPDLKSAYCPEVSKGEGLLFASRQLHGTMPNTSGHHRYSLELRFCLVEDLERADPALNVDNLSRGSFVAQFRHAMTGELCPQRLWKKHTGRP